MSDTKSQIKCNKARVEPESYINRRATSNDGIVKNGTWYELKCFKSYDIRGKVPEELNNNLAYQIGVAYIAITGAKNIVIGRDVRLESEELQQHLINGLNDAGANVVNIGLCGTEEIYYYAFANEKNIDGGIMVTASHNPKGYNGMKMVSKGARPMSLDDSLGEICEYIRNYKPIIAQEKGIQQQIFSKNSYIQHLLGYINLHNLKPLKIVVNPGNGPAGIIIKLLEQYLPFEFIYINEEPDGNFPNGVPNPMIIENRIVTSEAVKKHKADFGVAWDGDFDRCFLFDENGDFIEGYYVVGLLASSILQKHPGEVIVHDPRLIWNSLDIIKQHNSKAIQSKSGHSFIKKAMREENAIYGGEMSAHHYFRDFGYCDSGMIPWLLVAELLSAQNRALSSLVKSRQEKFPCSGEINYNTDKFDEITKNLQQKYAHEICSIEMIDGLSMEFSDWRFNLRKSNTEALVRLNIEVIGGKKSVQECLGEIESVINCC